MAAAGAVGAVGDVEVSKASRFQGLMLLTVDRPATLSNL